MHLPPNTILLQQPCLSEWQVNKHQPDMISDGQVHLGHNATDTTCTVRQTWESYKTSSMSGNLVTRVLLGVMGIVCSKVTVVSDNLSSKACSAGSVPKTEPRRYTVCKQG